MGRVWASGDWEGYLGVKEKNLVQQFIAGHRSITETIFLWGFVGLNVFTFAMQNISIKILNLGFWQNGAVLSVMLLFCLEIYLIWLLALMRCVANTDSAQFFLNKHNLRALYRLFELGMYCVFVPLLAVLSMLALIIVSDVAGLSCDSEPCPINNYLIFWTFKF